MANQFKIITKEYYDKYIDNLSGIKNESKNVNYAANDIFSFIKKFVNNYKQSFDIENLI